MDKKIVRRNNRNEKVAEQEKDRDWEEEEKDYVNGKRSIPPNYPHSDLTHPSNVNPVKYWTDKRQLRNAYKSNTTRIST